MFVYLVVPTNLRNAASDDQYENPNKFHSLTGQEINWDIPLELFSGRL